MHDFNVNLWLADRNPQYVITSPAPAVLDVSTRGDPSRKVQITLDPRTFLPIKQASISLSDPSHPVPAENRFDHWVIVGGIKFPERTSVYHSGMKRAQITVEQTRINSGIRTEDLLVKPVDLKPVL